MPSGLSPSRKKSRRFDSTGDLFAPRHQSSQHPTEACPPADSLAQKIHDVLRREFPSAAPPPSSPPFPKGSVGSVCALSEETPGQDQWLPARMLNEFVYCPRLFYYEHVEGIFVHNADTLRGQDLHRRVDSGKGQLPPPQAESEDIHSRSVSIGSERLCVTARLDLVESSESGAVRPVEYKVGAPREGEKGLELWPTDRMQLGLQILLLRDNGYTCPEGILYYRSTRQRITLPWTPELEIWILAQIQEARRTARGPIPPPLPTSAKCTRCSLNAICLPDETHFLQTAAPPQAKPPSPRQLLASLSEKRALYLNTPGLHVGIKDGRLIIQEAKRTVEEIRVNDLSHVALFGHIQITTQAVQHLCEKEIPITYFSMGGWFYGMTRGHGLTNVFTRIEQFRHASNPAYCLELARVFVFGKILNHRTLLMRLHVEPPPSAIARLKHLANSARTASSLAELLGLEGAAGALYFQNFAGMLKVRADEENDFIPGLEESSQERAGEPTLSFDFTGRNRRPPTDPINAVLSLAYSLLAKDCTIAAASVGLDPYVGFYHQPRFGRPALALDMMEEFRSLIAESATLTCINNGMLRPHHFVRAGQAVNLTPAGRKIFFTAYEQRMAHLITHPVFDYKASYRRVLEIQFRLLARYLTGEIAEYPPFLTR